MLISIGIPQYNRIEFLLKSLRIIEQQTYDKVEIVISDDCSSDDTPGEIARLKETYRFPIVYHRNEPNLGYDRNYRQCVELSSGDYVLIIGNDDTLNGNDALQKLVDFLEANNRPEVGFCNLIEERTGGTFIQRAQESRVIGTGPELALKYYSCFSFVGGLFYHRESFMKLNTDKMDGSIYSQIYMSCLMIAKGMRLFSIYEPLVIKDILLDGKFRHSYRDRIPKKWADYKRMDGGLPSVINVLITVMKDAGFYNDSLGYGIFKRIYSVTYPYWLMDYRSNGSYPGAYGLFRGLYPRQNKHFQGLSLWSRFRLLSLYYSVSFAGLVFPVSLYNQLKNRLYKYIKSR